ncbi:MAG: hypothetical protein WBZ36_28565 [Candidatus Nitrosopolaris sp.]
MNHKMRFAVAASAALLLVLSTTIIGSGHIALAYNNKFTRVFSNSGNNQETQQECGNSCTVTSSNTISSGPSTQPVTGQPPACLACFANLTSDQQGQFLREIAVHFPTIDTTKGFSNAVTQLCQILQANPTGQGINFLFDTLNGIIGISEPEALNITICVDRAI